jgi:threonine-phosphate decarboxylase
MSNDQLAQLFNVRSHNPSYFSVKDSGSFNGELRDFCIPVNLHFPPARMLDLIHEELSDILRYYPDYANVHQRYIGEISQLPPEMIVPCNGSTEIITRLCQQARGPILTSVPTFSRWTDLPEELNVPLYTIQRQRAKNFRLEVGEIVCRAREVEANTVVISNPNNPTGAWLSLDEIQELLSELATVDALIVDESFIDFSDLRSATAFAANSDRLIVVKSMGKSLGWHGVRLGFAVTNPRRAAELRAQLPFWNINGLAAYVLKIVNDFKDEYRSSFARVIEDRFYMASQLDVVPNLQVFPSKANFLFVQLSDGVSGRALRDCLLQDYGLMIRECSNKMGSSEQYLRLAVQRRDAVDELVRALRIEIPNSERAE